MQTFGVVWVVLVWAVLVWAVLVWVVLVWVVLVWDSAGVGSAVVGGAGVEFYTYKFFIGTRGEPGNKGTIHPSAVEIRGWG